MPIYLDADACPVKDEAERVATRLGQRLVIVSNGGLRPSANPLVEMVYVAAGPDEADKWIADHAGRGDVVVTADIPLAAKCVATGARVLKHDGEALTPANIGNSAGDARPDDRSAQRRPVSYRAAARAFTKADRSRFLDALDRTARAAMREAEG